MRCENSMSRFISKHCFIKAYLTIFLKYFIEKISSQSCISKSYISKTVSMSKTTCFRELEGVTNKESYDSY